MIKHMLKLMWNRKKSNVLIMVEIFLSFIVLFALASMVMSGMIHYTHPLGFSYDKVWVVNINPNSGSDTPREMFQTIGRELQGYDEINHFCFASGNLPYGNSRWTSGFKYGEREFDSDVFLVGDAFDSVMGINTVSGRWFSAEDDDSRLMPVVINRLVKETVFPGQNAIGETITKSKTDYIIVGMVEDYRYQGEFNDLRNGIFIRNNMSDTSATTMVDLVLSVRDGVGIAFEQELMDHLFSIAPGWTFKIDQMDASRVSYIKEWLLPLAVSALVAGFLIFNVALGLYGVLWYSINRRKPEIGLRRALGADSKQVAWQICGEALVIASFGIALGLFFAIQVPILGLFGTISPLVFIIAMIAAAFFVYLLVTLCALYPGRLASRIHPAVALHNE